MEVLLAVLGVALVLLALLDALWTTLWVDGSAGPVTGRITTGLWKAVLRLVGRRRHRALSLVGPAVLVLTLVQWVVLLWAGWTLLFGSDDGSLTRSSSPETAEWSGRIWYVGYTMFTVGNGDFTPREGLWQLVSGLVAFTGMSVVTLAVTYVLSVVSAVVSKRAFANSVHGLGTSAEELVLSGWDGQDLRALDLQLTELSSQLSQITEQYLSYPVLQYYHAASPRKSPVKAAAVLDDALTLCQFAVVPEQRPSPAALASARSSVQSFLQDTLEAAAVDPAPQPPPLPDPARLRAGGVSTVSDEEFRRAVEDLEERRRTHLGLVRGDGWEWET